MQQLRKFLFEAVQTIALALGIFAIVYLFLLQPHQVEGRSMEPNFLDGEYLLTEKVSYRFSNPKRGDVVVFSAPQTNQKDYIKRIVGLPGDTIVLKEGKIWVNGGEIGENYLPSSENTSGGHFISEGKQVTLNQGEYFVLGDNRGHSSDSRIWGTIKKENIVGRAWIVYWPPRNIRLIPSFSYAGR